MKTIFAFAIMTTFGLALALPTDSAVAQQNQRVSYKVTAENSKKGLARPVGHISRVLGACSLDLVVSETVLATADEAIERADGTGRVSPAKRFFKRCRKAENGRKPNAIQTKKRCRPPDCSRRLSR